MKIAVMNTAVVEPLLVNVESVCAELGWDIVRASEPECARMLRNNEVELALMSPLGYGSGVGKVDFRIVAGPAVSLSDYTETAGIAFKEGLEEIETVTATDPDSFLAVMGFLILREKFDSPADEIKKATPDSECLVTEDVSLLWTLDVSEEWFDITESCMPYAMWACRTEAEVDKVADAVRRMAAPDLVDREVVEHSDAAEDSFPRVGKVLYQWNDEVEEALEAVLNLLFFHQYLPELPEVKVLGREEW